MHLRRERYATTTCEHNMKFYLGLTTTLVLLLMVLAGWFNWVSDPYGIYTYLQSDEDRLSRIDQLNFHRVSKPYQIMQLRPEVVVLGTSRSARIDPAHDSWSGKRSYNASIPGLSRKEYLPYLQHIRASGPLEKLIIGLDFESYLGKSLPPQGGFKEGRLLSAENPSGSLKHILSVSADLFKTLLTTSASADSFLALSGQAEKIRRFNPDGRWSTLPSEFSGRLGFALMEHAFSTTRGHADPNLEFDFRQLQQLLSFCYEQGIETYLLVTPAHLFQLSVAFQYGYREAWQDWHEQLVALNSELGSNYDQPPFPVWVFNDSHGIVDEEILSAEESHDAWFKDSVHFRQPFADLIMDAMFAQESENQLGRMLGEGSVAAYLGDVLRMVDDYAPVMDAYHQRARLNRQKMKQQAQN